MADLSPAANAVWEAFNESLEQIAWFSDYGDALAAAIRAAALYLENDCQQLLAIADELES
jgi:hypothetical protein